MVCWLCFQHFFVPFAAAAAAAAVVVVVVVQWIVHTFSFWTQAPPWLSTNSCLRWLLLKQFFSVLALVDLLIFYRD